MNDYKNDFERLGIYSIEDLFKWEMMPNKVLVKFHNTHEKTVGGIDIAPSSIPFNYGQYTDRSATVVKVCRNLVCSKGDENSMLWECDIDILPGDEVFFDPTESLHAAKFSYEEEIYSIANYSSIVLAKRDGKVVVCNGYVLIEQVYRNKVALSYEKQEPIFNEGIVRYFGKPNKRYRTKFENRPRSDEGCPIKEGDRILLSHPQLTWFLEDWCFAVFDNRKIYKVCKRYMIGINYGNNDEYQAKIHS
jgi:co-chaperonin GroES (HSP10)